MPLPGRRGDALRRAVPVLLPAAAASALGLWGIDRRDSMWRDESVTYQVAHRSLGQLGHLLAHTDAVHGPYYLLMHAVFGLWDGGLPALRLPSVLAAALAAAGVGATGARTAGRRSGVLAGLVLALLPITQQYAQEGRSYALVTAGVTWATYLFLRGTEPAGRRWWPGCAAVLALACWLNVFAALVLPAQALTPWWLRVPRRVWGRWGAAATAVLVAVAPLAWVSAGQAKGQLDWLGRPSAAMWLQFAGVVAVGAASARLLLRGAGDGRSALVRVALPLPVAPAGLLLTVSLAHTLVRRPVCALRHRRAGPAHRGRAGPGAPAGVAARPPPPGS